MLLCLLWIFYGKVPPWKINDHNTFQSDQIMPRDNPQPDVGNNNKTNNKTHNKTNNKKKTQKLKNTNGWDDSEFFTMVLSSNFYSGWPAVHSFSVGGEPMSSFQMF